MLRLTYRPYGEKGETMEQYIIIGDTKEYEGCLVTVCGKDRDFAEAVLKRMTDNPNDNDRRITKGHSNLRLKIVDGGWWDDPFLLGEKGA